MADAPECKTLIQCNLKLQVAVQENLIHLSGQLLAAGLIGPDASSELRLRPESESAAELVQLITYKVQLNPSNYDTFINILSCDSHIYSDVLQTLNETYTSLQGSLTGARGSSVSIDDLRQQHVRIMQLLDLSTILPLINVKRIIPKEDYDKVANTKHHGSIERMGYLLHALYKQGQDAVDGFIQCLYETKHENPKHVQILQLFEGGLPDLPTRSPIFEILDQSLEDIERLIELMSFLNTLLEAEIISLSKFMDLQSPDRPIKENLERLFRTLEEKGTQGFIKFMSCLQKEGASTTHQHLFALLSEKVRMFFRNNPRRNEVQQGDRIELLQMAMRDQLREKRVTGKFEQHCRQLEAEIQLSSLMPYLQKQHVLMAQENTTLMEIAPERRNRELLEILVKKGPQFLVRFVECLEASPENKALVALFAPPSEPERLSQPLTTKKLPENLEKHGKVAVIIQMEQYTQLIEDYQLLVPFRPKIAGIREKLEQNLELLGFKYILRFKPSLDEEEEGQGIQVGAGFQRGKPKSLLSKFKEKVREHCKDGAVVFIFVSGLQYPFEDRQSGGTTSRPEGCGNFSAAILKDRATITSRQESECIRAKDLHTWAESLPNAHVTFLIDTHQSHIARFGLRRAPAVAEIMDDPWGELITPHSTTVVYYLRPDPTAMAHQMGITQERKEEGAELGMLTECFVSALLNCYKRMDSELGHRQVYEAVSLYWHRRGREHLLFVPAVQEYISPEHLLTKYGGYDQWQFVYEAERDKMLQLINSFHDIAAEDDQQEDSLIDDDRLTPVAEEEEEQDGEEEGNYRQRGEGGGRERGGGKQMLQRGSSTSSDVRRRQVTRLMSLQDSGKATSRSADRRQISDPSVCDPQSSIASLMGEEDVHRSSNETPPSLRRTGSSTIGDLMVSPWTLLQFPGKKDEESVCTLTLTNTSEKTVAYKIKTTAPLRYKVRPNLALIDAKAVAKVKVMLTSGSSSDDIIQDKFLVQTYTFDSKNSVPDENRLSSFWKGLPHGAIKEHRMRCRRMTSTAGKSTMKSESFSEGGVSGGGAHTMVAAATPRKTSEAQVTRASGGKSINVEREVARLVQVNNDLCKRMSRLQKLNYLTILLLLVLIAVVYLY